MTCYHSTRSSNDIGSRLPFQAPSFTKNQQQQSFYSRSVVIIIAAFEMIAKNTKHCFNLALFLYLSVPSVATVSRFSCPTPEELQSDWVKANFNETKMEGFWYELAMKDITQPRFCKCTTSNKTVRTEINMIYDTFTLECFGQPYSSDLSFELTDTPGVPVGTWNGIPLLRRVRFPNTIVDVGMNSSTGEYDWMIEFQCIKAKRFGGREKVKFYAFNFYSKEYLNMEERIQLMEQKARERGLGPFIDTGRSLAIIDHSNCAQGR